MEQPSEMDTFAARQAQFRNRFHKSPRIFRAPGRVNLIGEHTDYNEGFVMPAAIDLFTWVSIAPATERKIRVYSETFSEMCEISLESKATKRSHWSDYVLGVVDVLQRQGYCLLGADALIQSSIPVGAGLSSSAAIEVAFAYALLQIAGHSFTGKALALMCQQAENEFVGARCGIMDQFIATFGESEKALMLDCRSLEYQLIRLPEETSIVLCNTMVRHSLATGEYNLRRAECEEALHVLSRTRPGIVALRDVTPADIDLNEREMRDPLYRRCLHVVLENLRVQKAAQDLQRNDLQGLRTLMSASHRSLRDNYEVSCSELDIMVELAEQIRGVFGARMTGGGFGGCTVNLVHSDCVGAFVSYIREEYSQLTLQVPEIYVCAAASGVRELRPQPE